MLPICRAPQWREREREGGRERGDESLMKLVEYNLDSDFVSEKESVPIGVPNR